MAAQSGFGFMAVSADKRGTRDERDDAIDASRFFSRIGYVVLAVGAPVGVVLHPLGLYVMFSIGVGLILIAAALEAGPGFAERFMRPFLVPAFLALIAGLAWAALSILWTPYPVAAAQSMLKLSVLLAATLLAVGRRAKTRARPIFTCSRSASSRAWRQWSRERFPRPLPGRRTTAGSWPARSRSPSSCSRRSADSRRADATAWRGSC